MPVGAEAGPGQGPAGATPVVVQTPGSVPGEDEQTIAGKIASVASLRDGNILPFRESSEPEQTVALKTAPVQQNSCGNAQSQQFSLSAATNLPAFAIELCSGTAGLAAALRACGLDNAIGVDHIVKAGAKAPVCRLDVTAFEAQQLIRDWIRLPGMKYLHLGVPCGA